MHNAETDGQHRLAYVDRLRVGVIALVIIVHVCEVFNPWDEWHIANVERSRLAGEVVVLLAPWIMPLAMLLGGVSAWYSLQHRGNASYVRERSIRLLLPLVVGTLVLVPPQVYLERVLRGQFRGSFLAFYPHFFEGTYPRGNFSWHHLWFLGHLYGYSVLALPLFRYLQRPGGRKLLQLIARVAGSRDGVLWLAIPLILERNLLWGLFRERYMLTSDWSNHALLVVAYVYGFVLAGVPALRGAIRLQWRHALGLALLCTAALVAGTMRGFIPGRLPPPFSPGYLAFWTLYAFCAWAWIIAVLGAADRWLNDPDLRLTARLNRVSYSWYIVHQPVIVAVAFVVVPTSAALGVKFWLIAIVSLAGTLVTTEALRHVPIIGAAFGADGRRLDARAEPVAAASAWATHR